MIRVLTPREAEALLAAGGIDVVDVREPSEWAQGHLPGARHVPLGRTARRSEARHLQDKVLFVCASAGRAAATAARLAE